DPPAPVPHFLDAELAVDLQLVNPALRPFDFDRQLRPISRLRAEDVAFVSLGAAPLALSLQRPTAERRPFDPSIRAPRFEEASDGRFDGLMILRRTHDLDFPLQIADAWGGVVAADLEQTLVVVPRDLVKDDDGIGVRFVVVFAKRGGSGHAKKYIRRGRRGGAIGSERSPQDHHRIDSAMSSWISAGGRCSRAVFQSGTLIVHGGLLGMKSVAGVFHRHETAARWSPSAAKAPRERRPPDSVRMATRAPLAMSYNRTEASSTTASSE